MTKFEICRFCVDLNSSHRPEAGKRTQGTHGSEIERADSTATPQINSSVSCGFPRGSAQFPCGSAQFPCGSAQFPCGSARFPCGPARFPCGPAQLPCGFSSVSERARARQARDTKSPKWNSGDRRPTEQHSPSHRSGRRSGCARGGDSRPKHEKQPPSGASSHHAATEKREQRNDDHDETPRPARPPPRLFRR